MSESVTFLAVFPDVLAALKVAGKRNGMRVQLEIPESEMAQAVHLLGWREEILEVTVKRVVGQSSTNGSTKASKRSARSPLNMVGG